MTIAENVAYGLMVKGIDKSVREKRANEMLEIVRLNGVGDRRPAQLSGGQRQRVALARALVNEPEVLLLDEPLGALDLKLREQMQSELKQLQRRLGITFLFITHDQHEALVDERSYRRVQSRQDRADRHAVRNLQYANDQIRRAIYRRCQRA